MKKYEIYPREVCARALRATRFGNPISLAEARKELGAMSQEELNNLVDFMCDWEESLKNTSLTDYLKKYW